LASVQALRPFAWRNNLATAAAGIVVAAVVAGLGGWADGIAQTHYEARLKEDLGEVVSGESERVEQALANRIYLLDGLVALVRVDPQLDRANFDEFSASLLDSTTGIRTIGLAPEGMIRDVFPRAPNAAAVGRNLRTAPGQSETIVFLNARPGDQDRLWAIVSIVVDVDTLLTEAKIVSRKIELTLCGADGLGAAVGPIFGDPEVFARGAHHRQRRPRSVGDRGGAHEAAPRSRRCRRRGDRKSVV
jgi:sensor domain CHASE-containing protein